jgi:maltose O-acetyltransferase
MSKTEKEKMLAGEPYSCFCPELTNDRRSAKEQCYDYNHTRPSEKTKRQDILTKLIPHGGNDACIEPPFYCDYGYNIRLGKQFYANHGFTILDCNLVTIGDNCLIAPQVVISAATHPLQAATRLSTEMAYPITIGSNCWIGANATILPGVTIGDNVVIGAGAVVNKDIPDNVVCAGVPARVIRKIDQE